MTPAVVVGGGRKGLGSAPSPVLSTDRAEREAAEEADDESSRERVGGVLTQHHKAEQKKHWFEAELQPLINWHNHLALQLLNEIQKSSPFGRQII